MVEVKIIQSILEKCWTKAQIHGKLSSLTNDERMNLLMEQDKLTDLEWEEYASILSSRYKDIRELKDDYDEEIEEYREDYFDEHDEYPSKIPNRITRRYDKLFGEIEEDLDTRLFKYNRRIFEDYEISKGDNPIPSIEWDKYTHDDDGIEKYPVDMTDVDTRDMFKLKLNQSRESIGEVEGSLIDNQMKNLNFTDKEDYWLKQYFNDGRLPSFLTYMINGREPKQYMGADYIDEDMMELEEYSITDNWKKDFRNIKSHLDNAISKSNGLEQPTILYHAGRVDRTLLPGDKGIWKGYKSMSFQEQVMKKHGNINEDYWNFIILAPTGTKGICGNDERFKGYSFVDEHEYLTGRNIPYTVISIDMEHHTEIVKLD